MKIAVIGSGYVGLVVGACLAESGNDVVCADEDAEKVALLNDGEIPIYEPGLKPLIENNLAEGRLTFTTEVTQAVQASTVIFIAVGTPPGEDGSADLRHVLEVSQVVGKAMNGEKVVVTKSTVPVGTNAAIRDGDWKLVRPMISGTRYYDNPNLFVSEDDALRTSAFIEADIKHKEDPRIISTLLPVPQIIYPDAEEPELYKLTVDPGEQYNVASQHPDVTRRLLNELETWFESVEADRLSIDDPLHKPQTEWAD